MTARRYLDPERIAAGVRAELERSAHFEGDFDLGAAITASIRVADLLVPRVEELRIAAGLSASPRRFARRRARRAARTYTSAPVPTDRVFTFWNRPLEQAPPLVRACVDQMLRVYPHARVLDGASARELVEIPDRVATLLEDAHPAHFTDFVRTRLLEEHGGLWIDATAWVDRDLEEMLRPRLAAGTLFPRWTGAYIANWFIASQPRTPIITLQRLALEAWWENYDNLPDYFLFHRIFEVLCWIVPEFRGQWDAVPALSATSCSLLQMEMMAPHHPAVVRGILEISPLQKLSYKYDTVPEGSVLERLLAGDLRGVD